MRIIITSIWLFFLASEIASARAPLSYAAESDELYSPPKPDGIISVLDLITSRPELSRLAEEIEKPAGFSKAFDTVPTWNFTFFAPSNDAFNNSGAYFETYLATAKGIWWMGNLLNHHYVPNTALKKEAFNDTRSRLQTGSYLYIATQLVDDVLVLNNVAKVTEADIPATNGIIHIIDHIVDPSAQIFEKELPKVEQKFIAGSCSNPDLPYC